MPSALRIVTTAVTLLFIQPFAASAHGQSVDANQKAVIAVADSVLAALSSGDNATFRRLTLDSAVVGGIGLQRGAERFSMGAWKRFLPDSGKAEFTERGFGATALVQDRLAQVWMPYDLYVGKDWSHCGVDAFTLIKTDGRWRVASLLFTMEQPPACKKHPAGPPSQ